MIEMYSHEKHFELLKSWFDKRDMPGLERWMLPDLGLVLEKSALAFLVTTNSPVAWIAHWAVDPKLDRHSRDVAFCLLSKEMEHLAREKGFRLLQTIGLVGHHLSLSLRREGFLKANGAFNFFCKDIGA